MEKDIILFLVGLVVGSMNAIAGGGMLVGFPVLVALGLPPLVANATGNIITAPGQLASAIGYRTYLRKVPKLYTLLLIPTCIGAALGALSLRHTTATHFAQLVPVLVLFGVGLFAFQPLLHFHLNRNLKRRTKTYLPIVLIGLGMLPIAYYGGYFGAGVGFIMLAFLGLTNMHDTHLMNAMKNVAAIGIATTSIICLYSTHLIDWRHGLMMAVGSVTGGYIGARLAQKVSSHWLRIAIIGIGLVAAIYLGIQEY